MLLVADSICALSLSSRLIVSVAEWFSFLFLIAVPILGHMA